MSEDEREHKLATVTAPDNAPASEVMDYVLMCARLWEPEARIIGNARAADIVRAISRPTERAVTEAIAALERVTAVLDSYEARFDTPHTIPEREKGILDTCANIRLAIAGTHDPALAALAQEGK